MTAISPRVMAGASVSLGKVLDLTDAKVLSAIGFSFDDLIDEDWRSIQSGGEESWTQAIGRGSVKAGFEALIVPSAQSEGGKNIVIFPQNQSKASGIRILRAKQLPK